MIDLVMKERLIAPSILAADFTRLGDQIRQAEEGGADWIHLDIMDGHFVPNLSMGPAIVAACRRATRLPLDVHLMVEWPDRLMEAFAEAGADHLIVHVECCPHLNRMLQAIQALGLRAGVSLNPATPPEAISEVLPIVDEILVMTVNPGFGGQEFIESTVPKVKKLRRWLDEGNYKALIEVDGGISSTTAPLLAEAGARVFISGTSIFGHPEGVEAGLRALRLSIAQVQV